jgi:hypothetical protein
MTAAAYVVIALLGGMAIIFFALAMAYQMLQLVFTMT